ncbi:hypothetical protein COOONC_23703 [Cooperia oncophora]
MKKPTVLLGELSGFWLMSSRNLKFLRVGLPFFSIVLGGAYGLHYFQQVRYDFRKLRQQDSNLEHLRSELEKSGLNLRKDVTVDSVYKEVAVLDTENWENIRGPREDEDIKEYLRVNVSKNLMAEQIPEDQLPRAPSSANLDISDNPPEPDNASIRAERGLLSFLESW